MQRFCCLCTSYMFLENRILCSSLSRHGGYLGWIPGCLTLQLFKLLLREADAPRLDSAWALHQSALFALPFVGFESSQSWKAEADTEVFRDTTAFSCFLLQGTKETADETQNSHQAFSSSFTLWLILCAFRFQKVHKHKLWQSFQKEIRLQTLWKCIGSIWRLSLANISAPVYVTMSPCPTLTIILTVLTVRSASVLAASSACWSSCCWALTRDLSIKVDPTPRRNESSNTPVTMDRFCRAQVARQTHRPHGHRLISSACCSWSLRTHLEWHPQRHQISNEHLCTECEQEHENLEARLNHTNCFTMLQSHPSTTHPVYHHKRSCASFRK